MQQQYLPAGSFYVHSAARVLHTSVPTGEVLAVGATIGFYVRPAPKSKKRKRVDGGESGEEEEEGKEENEEDTTPDRDKGCVLAGADGEAARLLRSFFGLFYMNTDSATVTRFVHAVLAGAEADEDRS
jgi:hypothetical protein